MLIVLSLDSVSLFVLPPKIPMARIAIHAAAIIAAFAPMFNLRFFTIKTVSGTGNRVIQPKTQSQIKEFFFATGCAGVLEKFTAVL